VSESLLEARVTTLWIRRSVFGWWVACNPNEALGVFDTPTYYRSWTRERLEAKLRRKFAVKPIPWEEIEV
jgi:hypothetical protein